MLGRLQCCFAVGDKLSAISVGLIVTATVATAILVIIGGIAFYCQSRARRQAELYGKCWLVLPGTTASDDMMDGSSHHQSGWLRVTIFQFLFC